MIIVERCVIDDGSDLSNLYFATNNCYCCVGINPIILFLQEN